MSKSKKTFNVEDFKNEINRLIAISYDDEKDRRVGYINALEHVLHETGNYHGFMYLEESDITHTTLAPGIRIEVDENGNRIGHYFEGTDRTRVRYF